jgi:hypothetical protein
MDLWVSGIVELYDTVGNGLQRVVLRLCLLLHNRGGGDKYQTFKKL